MVDMPTRRLGSSELEVSLLSLGSWRTFEHIGFDRALEVMRAARDAGITFLDDARYDDETGQAPLRTGYSEVLFGELFRATGWGRDEVVVANKLWWEFWPDQTAAEELDASLERMELDHVDLIYTMPPPEGHGVTDLVSEVAALVASGRARAWGVGNWPHDLIAVAQAWCRSNHLPMPCAAQLPYSLVRPGWVEADEMSELLDAEGLALVASFVLAGGVLSGKYLRGESGRVERHGDPTQGAGDEVAQRVGALAGEWEATPAQVAICFALAHPATASVLFGATSPDQLAENVGALEVWASLDDRRRAQLRDIAATAEG